MSTDTYYVSAVPDPINDSTEAVCTFYTRDSGGTFHELPDSNLSIPLDAGSCKIIQRTDSDLILMAAAFKTMGRPPTMNDQNYAPANDEGQVTIAMPTIDTVTKSAVLMFAHRTEVTTIYANAMPEITNDT